MLIFRDIVTDDELVTDVKKMIDVGNGLYEVELQLIKKNSEGIDDSLIGGNASAEEAAEDVEVTVTMVYDVLEWQKLVEMPRMSKSDYKTYFKGYGKTLMKILKERGKDADYLKQFQKDMEGAAKFLFKNIGDYDFYSGESMNPDGMLILRNFREDGSTAYLTYFKHGLLEEKF